jgi:hypothetical protein
VCVGGVSHQEGQAAHQEVCRAPAIWTMLHPTTTVLCFRRPVSPIAVCLPAAVSVAQMCAPARRHVRGGQSAATRETRFATMAAVHPATRASTTCVYHLDQQAVAQTLCAASTSSAATPRLGSVATPCRRLRAAPTAAHPHSRSATPGHSSVLIASIPPAASAQSGVPVPTPAAHWARYVRLGLACRRAPSVDATEGRDQVLINRTSSTEFALLEMLAPL